VLFINNHQTPDDFGRFVSRTPSDAHKFFVSMPFFSARGSLATAAEYREIIFKMVHRDLFALEKLQYDKRLSDSIGSLSLRAWILDGVWKRFQQVIPALSQAANDNVSTSNRDLALVTNLNNSTVHICC
jgi:hypothetical protein